jgi:hypothetical protein
LAFAYHMLWRYGYPIPAPARGNMNTFEFAPLQC